MKSTAREGKSSLLKAETGGDPLLAEGQSPDANRENLLTEAKSGRKRGMKRALKRAACVLTCAVFAVLALLGAFGCSSSATKIEGIACATVKEIPALFLDTSEGRLTDESIGTDELVFSCKSGSDVRVEIETGADKVTLSEAQEKEENGVVTVTYTLTAKAAGAYTLRFYKGTEKDGVLSLSVREAYPSDPSFDAFNRTFASSPSSWGTMNAHDPSMIEVNGTYYAFSTGNNGQSGYQIRKSDDLIHWTYVGQAFSSTEKSLKKVIAQLKDLYTGGEVNTEVWAPDIVPASGGGFWLYGCLTAAFGKNFSVIFQAYADKIEGGFSYKNMLVVTGGNWGTAPNAIDPQIFYDREGRMYMTYGSFAGGIRILELDATTGLRKDGYTYAMYEEGEITSSAYYGADLTYTSNVEGPVAAYREGVDLYNGDIFAEEYDASAWTKQDLYYLMGSADSLSADYTMRAWKSGAPASGYEGNVKTSGSFSWRHSAADGRIGYDFFAPGHNDIFSASDGTDLIVYHNRTDNGENWPHYLFASMYALNANGDIVISPNRYAGEGLRKITEEELTQLSGGNYDYVRLSRTTEMQYAQEGLRLHEDGTLSIGGENKGTWVLYGDYYVAFTVDGTKYYGVAMPAFIEAEGQGGITISAMSENGYPFYMNMDFSD